MHACTNFYKWSTPPFPLIFISSEYTIIGPCGTHTTSSCTRITNITTITATRTRMHARARTTSRADCRGGLQEHAEPGLKCYQTTSRTMLGTMSLSRALTVICAYMVRRPTLKDMRFGHHMHVSGQQIAVSIVIKYRMHHRWFRGPPTAACTLHPALWLAVATV